MLGTHFSWGDPSSGIGSNVQRDVRGLGRVVGGQEGGEGDVEREFSPMNHFWAAAISSLSRWLSFPDVSFYLHWDLTPHSPFKWISVPSSVLLFQGLSGDHLLLLFIAGTCIHSISLPLWHTLWRERVCWGWVLTQLCCGQRGRGAGCLDKCMMQRHSRSQIKREHMRARTHVTYFYTLGIVWGQILCQPGRKHT